MRLARLAAFVVAFTLGWAPPAEAQWSFPGLSEAGHSRVEKMMRAAARDADQWWEQLTGRQPPPLRLWLFTQFSEAPAYGAPEGGHVYISRKYRSSWWAQYRNEPRRESRRELLLELWWLMAHERGHNLGLEHGDCPGIMCATDGARHYPQRALSWARNVLVGSKRRQSS